MRILQVLITAAMAEKTAIPTAKNIPRQIPQKLRHSEPTSSCESTKLTRITTAQDIPPKNLGNGKTERSDKNISNLVSC